MPTYEYLCSHCGNAWEEIQKISEPPIQVCPKCSNPTAKRQISGGSFILKGGGWYADLYSSAKPSSKKEDGGESKSASEPKDKKETSSSDSKPEAKEAAPAKAESPAPSKAPAASSGPAK